MRFDKLRSLPSPTTTILYSVIKNERYKWEVACVERITLRDAQVPSIYFYDGSHKYSGNKLSPFPQFSWDFSPSPDKQTGSIRAVVTMQWTPHSSSFIRAYWDSPRSFSCHGDRDWPWTLVPSCATSCWGAFLFDQPRCLNPLLRPDDKGVDAAIYSQTEAGFDPGSRENAYPLGLYRFYPLLYRLRFDESRYFLLSSLSRSSRCEVVRIQRLLVILSVPFLWPTFFGHSLCTTPVSATCLVRLRTSKFFSRQLRSMKIGGISSTLLLSSLSLR